MLACPVCESDNIRVSFNAPLWEFVYRWQGLQRLRCRECRSIFHRPLSPGEDVAMKLRRRRRRTGDDAATAKNRQRKALGLGLFLVMVVAFYAALKAFNA